MAEEKAEKLKKGIETVLDAKIPPAKKETEFKMATKCPSCGAELNPMELEYTAIIRPKALTEKPSELAPFELATKCPKCETEIAPMELEYTVTASFKPEALAEKPEEAGKSLQKLGGMLQDLGKKLIAEELQKKKKEG